MRAARLLALVALVALVADSVSGAAQRRRKKKSEEEVTQVLELPKDLPAAVSAETSRLVFHVSRLSARGLLSQQVRDALKDLQRQAGSAAPVKLRALVAGSGDLRRVQALVSETYTERRLPLPALSVVQVGGLPLEGAQVALEAYSQGRKAVNPGGLAFLTSHGTATGEPFQAVGPLLAKSLENLSQSLSEAGLERSDVLLVTCFASSLDGAAEAQVRLRTQFPAAAVQMVQLLRAPVVSFCQCEAVARLRQPMGEPWRVLRGKSSDAALVSAPRIVMSGTQLAFGERQEDIRLAFERLDRALDPLKARLDGVVLARLYPLTAALAKRIQTTRPEFFGQNRSPAVSVLYPEGLPSLDASFALDVVAVPRPEPGP